MIRPAPAFVAALAALLAVSTSAIAADPALTTLSERSGFLKTGRYDEVIALCDAFAKRYPAAVRCRDFGTTPEGRPMKLLVVSKTGAFTPEAAKAKHLPVLLVQGGISLSSSAVFDDDTSSLVCSLQLFNRVRVHLG